MQNLYIRIFSNRDELEWVLLGSNGQVLRGPSVEFDPSVFQNPKQTDVIVVVPGADVVLTSVQVPKMTHARLMQAIPNLLEENVAESTEQLHFAIGQQEAGQPLAVAVVSKQKMQLWLRKLQEKFPGIQSHISAFTPDTLCLPWAENQWTALSDHHQMIVRTGQASGYTVEQPLFTLLTQRLIETQGGPDAIHLYGSPDGQDLSKLDASVNQHAQPESTIVSFAEQLQGKVQINLLQQEFERDHKYRVTIKLAKVLALLIAVWVAIMTVIDFTKYAYLNQRYTELHQEVSAVYKEIFPMSSSVVSPKSRIERLLKDNQASGNSDFIKLLAQVAPVIQKSKNVKVTELNYEKSVIEINLEASDFDLLDKLVTDLKSTGIKVNQRGASKTGNTIQSKVVVEL